MYLYICSTGNHIFGGQITRAPSLRVSVYKLHIVQRNQAPLPIQWSFQPPRLFGFSHICDDDIWLEGQLRFIVCLALVQCPSRPFFGCFVCIVRVIPHHLETSRQTSRQWRGPIEHADFGWNPQGSSHGLVSDRQQNINNTKQYSITYFSSPSVIINWNDTDIANLHHITEHDKY